VIAVIVLLAGVHPGAAMPSVAAPSGSSSHLHIPAGGGAMQAGATTSPGTAPRSSVAAASATYRNYPVRGIDVASYQGNVAWATVARAGDSFAYVKATEGTTYTNPYYAQQSSGAKASGLYAGSYAFARPDGNDPVQQARRFLAMTNFVPDGHTLPPMLDLEEPYPGSGVTWICWGLSPAGMIAWVTAFVGTVTAATGERMLIYTGASWWNQCTGNSTALAAELLYVPYWTTTTVPGSLPAGWSAWTFWQYANSGSLPGDQDVFGGTLVQLATLAKPALAPGTSPSVATLAGGGSIVAYQSILGTLVTLGTPGFRNWGLGMAAGTSPSVAALKDGSWEVAFQANSGSLWTVGATNLNWHLGMAAGTSPSVAALKNGSWEVAFRANSGSLWTVGATNLSPTHLYINQDARAMPTTAAPASCLRLGGAAAREQRFFSGGPHPSRFLLRVLASRVPLTCERHLLVEASQAATLSRIRVAVV
jgi:GH25 family lysozyme M1 (1,4-beta-N-acetylmuramidase)